ncbi:MAG TPA: L,D-transpeptidase family protein [Candidatus Akkermansia intestinigallinarum]|uniref:L,D-transpeptidase family protein n=1 Tax=Candidatus Akkermansia intestinigallinarum TaxID=2838431 RepID=A0A9D1VCK0_9BACT|nr:L,D-transpeptidase family protein [Candidatus Akkermansia intestinigallinarum]
MRTLSLLTLPALLLAACSSTQNQQNAPAHRNRVTVSTIGNAATAGTATTAAPAEPSRIPGNILDLPGKDSPTYVNSYPEGSYAHFVAQKKYPKTLAVYSNDELLRSLTRDNSKIIICIPQQRARLYVNNRVALDWPVSTGTYGHETPTGVFRVMEKDKDHKSNRYGRFINENGRTTNSNADLSKGLPKGHTFRAAGMPNWLRLTPDGVGIHGGRVVAGRRLSHGCIRTPYDVAAKLFEHAVVGMPVYISRAVEDYSRGGYVKPIDVKYRPKPGNDYTDMPVQVKTIE